MQVIVYDTRASFPLSCNVLILQHFFDVFTIHIYAVKRQIKISKFLVRLQHPNNIPVFCSIRLMFPNALFNSPTSSQRVVWVANLLNFKQSITFIQPRANIESCGKKVCFADLHRLICLLQKYLCVPQISC